ncbi:hypothetical protein BDV34DRAFT_186885 [Aspergillus parasiticus]|uniref:Uncharacterized protein n=1 Tax=Aspergillus parasiticus TaxID=5067 RepID=A0A5N6E2B0_ASPPA|nr:hypothetical protein BDV34DRAFT_186885 [Aspergillus parasiticus]
MHQHPHSQIYLTTNKEKRQLVRQLTIIQPIITNLGKIIAPVAIMGILSFVLSGRMTSSVPV